MPTVKETMKQEIYKLCGDAMDVSDEVVGKIDDEEFDVAAQTLYNLATRMTYNAQALAGLKVMGEDTMEKEWDEFEEEEMERQKERQREYNRQMKNILGQMLGLDLDNHDEDED